VRLNLAARTILRASTIHGEQMSRPIGITPPGSAPGPSFDEPFEMLQACHERMGRMLALLQKLRSHMRGRPADDQARQAARDVMRYFDVAAPQHHRDEELHVFPSLIGLHDAELAGLVARLQQDHLQMEARWKPARSLLEEVAQGGRTAFNEADDAVFDAFVHLYDGHIEAEESVAFPRAMAAMEPQGIDQMGREMAGRRGVATSRE
jgi:hemerythrin-like domain-containing protein